MHVGGPSHGMGRLMEIVGNLNIALPDHGWKEVLD